MLASFLFFLLAGNSYLNQVDIWRSLVIFIVDKNDKKVFYYNEVKLRSKQSFISWQLLMFAFFFFSSQLEIHTLIKSIFGGVLANITIEKKKNIVYYNQVNLWSIWSICKWQLLMLAVLFLRSCKSILKSSRFSEALMLSLKKEINVYTIIKSNYGRCNRFVYARC